jgi:hypothetical protein
MSKASFNRLKNRYGIKITNSMSYVDIVSMIIKNNSENIQDYTGKVTIDKLKARSIGQIQVPELSDVSQSKNQYLAKASERGKLLVDTLKERLVRRLKEALTGSSGTVSIKKSFKDKVAETMQSYTKKPRANVPSALGTIARTETRTAIDIMKNAYMDKLQEFNPTMQMVKVWIHRGRKHMGYEPREGHVIMDGVEMPLHGLYPLVDNDGEVHYARFPHDPNLPASEVINCSCEMKYFLKIQQWAINNVVHKAKEGDKKSIFGKPATFTGGEWVVDGESTSNNNTKNKPNKGKESLLKEKTLNDTEKAEAKKFLKGEPIETVKSGIIKSNDKDAIAKGVKLAEKYSETIDREDIGEVIFNPKGIQRSLSHGFNQKKLDAIPAIPAVIKQGKILDISDDFDGKKQKNIFMAAPIKIDNNSDILAVRLRQNEGDSARFYVHEVFNIGDIERATHIKPGQQTTNGSFRPQRGIALYLNILKDIFDVK